MPRTSIKSRLHCNKHKPKIKQEPIKTQSNLPPNLQTFKQKLLSGSGFREYKHFYKLRLFENLNNSGQNIDTHIYTCIFVFILEIYVHLYDYLHNRFLKIVGFFYFIIELRKFSFIR